MFIRFLATLPVLLAPILAASLACAADQNGAGNVGAAIEVQTNRHTRIVWVQDAGPTACVYVEKPTVLLMGIDSSDGKGEHPIIPAQNAFYRPLLTADGQRIVYTQGSAALPVPHSVWVVPFAGGEPKQILADGVAEDVWTDPIDGVTWVYVHVSEKRGEAAVDTLQRVRLDQPGESELVWDKTSIGHVQISGDGSAGSGGNNVGQGIFRLPNDAFASPTPGCWPSMSPDDSHRFWVFTGNHRWANIFEPVEPGAMKFTSWSVDFSTAPGIPGNCEVYHPRWSNDIRFMTMTGPYARFDWQNEAKITNEVAAGVEVYLGRFSADLHKIEQWVQITHNSRGDYFPDAWIEPQAGAKIAVKRPPPMAHPKTATDEGLQFVFTDSKGSNQVPEADGKHIRLCALKLTGSTRYGRSGVVDSAGGAAFASHAEQVIQACRTANAMSLSCVLTPAAVQVCDQALIAGFADGEGRTDLALIQAGGRLLVTRNGSRSGAAGPGVTTVDLGDIVAGRPLHVALSVASGQLHCYLDGRRVLVGEDAPGDLKVWTATTIVFGADASNARAWTGSLCDIVIHSRAIDAAEAAACASAARGRETPHAPAPRVVVDAVLVGHTAPADPKAIAPYVRCLSLSTYDVTAVISGTCTAKRVAVFQWSVLDGKRVQAYEALKGGEARRLVLEAFSDHPEQEPERQTNEVDGTDDLPLFYDVEFGIPPNLRASDKRWTGASTADALWSSMGPPSPWSPSGSPTALDRVQFDTVASGKRTVTIDQPTVISSLEIRQLAQGAANTVVVKAPLRISGGAVPALAQAGAGATLRVVGAPMAVVTPSMGEIDLEGRSEFVGDGGVRAVHVYDGGTRYSTAPTVTFVGTATSSGTGAIGQATLSVAIIHMTHLGTGYTSVPLVSFSDPGTSGGTVATGAAVLNAQGAMERIDITDPGSGYLEAPAIAISGGGGSGAGAQALCRVSAIALIAPGKGYASPPAVTLDGGGGSGAVAMAHTQRTVFASTDIAGTGLLVNKGTIIQDGALLLFDRASPTFDRRAHASFRNEGTWTITHGGLAFSSSTGLAEEGADPCINAGTLTLLDGSALAFREMTNSGTMVLGAGVTLSSLAFATDDVTLRNGAKGRISIRAGSQDRPVVLGCVGPTPNGSRLLANGAADEPAQLEIGDGKDSSTLVLSGSQCEVDNAAGSKLMLNHGAMLALMTNDAGAQQVWRHAMISNHGLFDFSGTLRLCGSGWGPIAIDNDGTVMITGEATYERLQDVVGGTCTWSAFENHDKGIITGDGTLRYVDHTHLDPQYDRGSSLIMLLSGTILPASPHPEGAPSSPAPATLTFVGVDMVLGPKAWVHALGDAPTGFPINDMANGCTFTLRITSPAGGCDHVVLKPGTEATKGGSLAFAAGIGSTLDLQCLPGVTPTGTYTVITAAAITGQFDHCRYQGKDQVPYTVHYTPTTVEVVFP